jgi:soluble lytic murein transglycosylase
MWRFSFTYRTFLTIGVLLWVPETLHAWDEFPECAEHIQIDNHLFSEPEAAVEYSQSNPWQDFFSWTEPITDEQARSALLKAEGLIGSGQLGDALLQLRVVEEAFPLVADYFALIQADLLLRMREPREACRAYAVAEKSPNRSIAIRGFVGTVACTLEAGNKEGETLLQRLVKRYPKLPDSPELRYTLAQARKRWNDLGGAVRLYQSISLNYPESPFADKAQQELARIQSTGFPVRGYTSEELVSRAERLVNAGPLDRASEAVHQLIENRSLKPALKARVHLLAARIAKIEGHWTVVKNEVQLARGQGVSVPSAARYLPPADYLLDKSDAEKAERAAILKIRQIRGGRIIRSLPNTKLIAILHLAVENDLQEAADDVVAAMRSRNSLNVKQRFDAAILAIGAASDEAVAGLLNALVDAPRFGVPARYHYARTFERLGRLSEAETEYRRVIDLDRSDTRYYAMWARLRIQAMHDGLKRDCVPGPTTNIQNKESTDSRSVSGPAFDKAVATAGASDDLAGRCQSIQPEPPKLSASADNLNNKNAQQKMTEEVIPKLQALAQAYGQAYPWLERALDLARLGEPEAAVEELNETYLAWRDVKGGPRLRSGLETIYTGTAIPRHPVTAALRRERLALDQTTRLQLAKIADTLGDEGIAAKFDTNLISRRPRAYSIEVERAAQQYGVDPNLLFAVMRVESIYNRRIVSHAGAIGLMQIMPRTARLIAHELGLKEFGITDLLNPQTSLTLAAWYLSSLLHRFDGRTPLAIAAYNGGPHNVRSWLHATSLKMPLDAFLERIPLTETHRYVRRVLTHYAAYRAQQGLPPENLDVTLPEPKEDPIAF